MTKASGDGKTIFVGKEPDATAYLTLSLANRHGLVTGATGTGKTVTLQVLAEGFAAAGVPVFAAVIVVLTGLWLMVIVRLNALRTRQISIANAQTHAAST